MIVLSKRRILIVTGLMLTAVFTFMIQTSNENTVQTVALPVSNKVIVLDAGHGVPDERSSK